MSWRIRVMGASSVVRLASRWIGSMPTPLTLTVVLYVIRYTQQQQQQQNRLTLLNRPDIPTLRTLLAPQTIQLRHAHICFDPSRPSYVSSLHCTLNVSCDRCLTRGPQAASYGTLGVHL
eukprot:3636268-Pyramimonas_sp.AAC.2